MAEALMTYADRAVALHFARGNSPEGHPGGPRVETLETHIVTLQEAVAEAKAIAEQRRQEAEVARKKINGMAVEIGALSKQIAEQSAANDKLQAELEKIRSEFNGYWERECRNSLPHQEPSQP